MVSRGRNGWPDGPNPMNEIETLNNRIDTLEARVAHQDRMLEELNVTITAQWKQIESLTRQIARLGDQMQEIRDRAGSDVPEPPRRIIDPLGFARYRIRIRNGGGVTQCFPMPTARRPPIF